MKEVVYAITVLLIESDYAIIEEIVDYIKDKYSCQVDSIRLPSTRADKICLSGLEIFVNEMQVIYDETPVVFSQKEFSLLLYLAKHPGWVFTKEQIYEAVWGDIPVSVDAKVECMIYSIRKKLRKYTDREYIQTVWGVGYKFDPGT